MMTEKEDGTFEHPPFWMLIASYNSNLTDETLIAVFVMLMFAFMLAFYSNPIRHFTEEFLPKSLMFIIAGLLVGILIRYLFGSAFLFDRFTEGVFLWVLLPPIILTATYKLYSREFFLQLDGVLLLAVVGTFINMAALSLAMYGADVAGLFSYDISVSSYLVLATILSAVDPVAVLTVFDELNVKKSLSVLVLGESLLNDGVTLVLFHSLMHMREMHSAEWAAYGYVAISFLSIGLGGFLIGVVFGVLTALMCRLTQRDLYHFEPVWIFSSIYLSFLSAQIIRWSGIMAIIGCGLTHKRYAFKNINKKSQITVEAITEGLSVTMETIIFLLFGTNVFSIAYTNVFPFAIFVFVVCLVLRFVITFLTGAILNYLRYFGHINKQQLFIISYGGLRGAVSYSMARGLEEPGPTASLFQATTLLMILFTCFLQGGTIRFIVQACGIQEKKNPDIIAGELVEESMIHTIAGLAVISGVPSRTRWMEKLECFDKKYIQKYLCDPVQDGDEDLPYPKFFPTPESPTPPQLRLLV